MIKLLDLEKELGVTFRRKSWGQHAPGHPLSGKIWNTTADKIRQAVNDGKTIVIGNNPTKKLGKIAQVNSRFHGWSIRTIHAV
ncbi:MAG: hypothetical protein AB1478_02735 [Nitrospirota bacterium]